MSEQEVEIGTHIHEQLEELNRLHAGPTSLWVVDDAYQLLAASKGRTFTAMGTQDGRAVQRMRQINDELEAQRLMKGLR